MNAIQLDHVSKSYKIYAKPNDRLKEALLPFGKKYHYVFSALNNISLKVNKGEILGIVGRNGAGKSTLLKIIAGISPQTSGCVQVNGNTSVLMEIGSGFNLDFTGYENIYFLGTMIGYSRKYLDRQIQRIIDFADIGDFIHQPFKIYSSGMKARLGFSLAVYTQPEILIVDEVLGVGDVMFQRKCNLKIHELFKSGCTVLFCSHNENAVTELCTRAILLENGELLLDGSPKSVLFHYLKLMDTLPIHYDKTISEIKYLSIRNLSDTPSIKKSYGINHYLSGREIEKPEAPIRFDLRLKPLTSIITQNYHTQLLESSITTINGERANSLIYSMNYFYTIRIRFGIDLQSLNVMMSINDKKGFTISSCSYPHKKKFDDITIHSGAVLQFRWMIKCNLLSRHYFTSFKISSMIGDEEKCLISVRDDLVFHVKNPIPGIQSGYVKLVEDFEIREIKEIHE